jgi:hypothetical protein
LQKTYTTDLLMKSRLSDLQTQHHLEQTLNNNVKVVKVVRFTSTTGGNEGPLKKLLVVQVLNNNECYVIDEAKLTESAVGYVRSYLPEALEEEEKTVVRLEPRNMQEIRRLEEQVREIREDRLSLH